jgi:hypothetical protein
MGSYFSSSSRSINDAIEEMIYYPPNTPDKLFANLNTNDSILKSIKLIGSEQDIYLVTVNPKNKGCN